MLLYQAFSPNRLYGHSQLGARHLKPMLFIINEVLLLHVCRCQSRFSRDLYIGTDPWIANGVACGLSKNNT